MPLQYVPVALTPGMFGLDTTYKLTLQPGLIDKLCGVDLHVYWPSVCPPNTFLDFFGRYVPLPGNDPGWDIDGAERQAIAAAGKYLLLFQHVRQGAGAMGIDGWKASGPQGEADALYAAKYAIAHGYAPVNGYPPPDILKDMENVANPGPDALASMQRYRDAMVSVGMRGPGYRGFNSGITTGQWAAIGTPVMCDAGNRHPPPGRGYAIKQHLQARIFGIDFDLDVVLPDATGDVIHGMGLVDVEQGIIDVDPHSDPDETIKPV